jgi:hypothetical protein
VGTGCLLLNKLMSSFSLFVMVAIVGLGYKYFLATKHHNIYKEDVMDQIRISAKNLGELALPNFCPRCFWIKLHNKYRLPYQIFPGIFASIDSYSKKITNLRFDRQKYLPGWFAGFGPLGKPIKIPSLDRFCIVDTETNIKLRGIPDEMFLRENGSYFIADYKTAKFTDKHDELYPMYDVQLNAYAYIAEKTSYSPVTGLGLVYYEPMTDITLNNIDSFIHGDGFSMNFVAKLLPIDLRPDNIQQLLHRARQIYDQPEAPERGRNCKDCDILDEIVALIV